MAADETLYEEADGIAIIAINRPEKKNSLTNSVIQGIEDGIDRASRAKDVSAVVLRGIGGATDLILCCDQLYMASDAHIGYAPSRIYGTPTTMLWVYRLKLEHAKQFLLTGRAIDAATAYRWVEDFADKGFRQTIRDRDRPWGDYGERPKEDGG